MQDLAQPCLTTDVAIVGGGPAGLMAAQVLLGHGLRVDLFDAMPSVGRKFLLAGKGGLNLTHAEPQADFLGRYGARKDQLEALLRRFGADEVRAWAAGLGIETFVGSSQRVFPRDMKAAPLLRAWLHRMRAQGLRLHMRHRWIGFAEDAALRFQTPDGPLTAVAKATVLALGGGSWPQLGSNGAWQPLLRATGVQVEALAPSNCGFDTQPWSAHLRDRFAGAPLKTVAIRWSDAHGRAQLRRGEFVLTQTGVEGSLIYAASADLRQIIARDGKALLLVDLLPDRDAAQVQREAAHPRGSRSWASHLQSRLGLIGVKVALLRECLPREAFDDPVRLAAAIKALPLTLLRTRPLAEAISSAGGVSFDALDERLMLRVLPGVFCAGEMLDWEAPTGGYLLTACLATGRAAGEGALRWSGWNDDLGAHADGRGP